MKGLATLVRARQRELDEKRRALGELQDQANEIIAARDALAGDQRREAELALDSPDGGFGYGAFLKAARMRDAAMQADLDALETRINAARDEISEAFAEIKRFELIQAAQEERARKEAAKREQEELDELGLNVFRRNEA